MKQSFYYMFLLLVVFVSCKKNIQDLNANTKSPITVTPGSLFANAEKVLVDTMTSANVDFNVFRLLAQQWTQTTYTDESNFDLNTRELPQRFWSNLYRDVLNELKMSDSLIPSQDPLYVSAAVKQNEKAAVKVLQVYTYATLVNTFGNIPYTEALKVNSIASPKYDDAKTVYYAILDSLDKAIAAFTPGSDVFGSSDLLLGGDVTKWKTFAYSLKLRLGMIIADFDAAKAKTVVESAAPFVIQSNNENIIFKYLSAPPNTNPIWVDLVQSGRKDFVAANTIVDTMNSLSDPRRPFYFTLDANSAYSGGEYGSNNTYATYSKPSAKITAPNFESILIDYAEVEFLLAEAKERGFAVSGTAKDHYNNAITASIAYWGGTASDAAAYLANPAVDYTLSAKTWKQKIGYQKWLALYNRGFDAWTEWRRLDAPKLVAPADAVSDIPVRYTYPTNEQTLNAKNYKAAAAAIGGDDVSTKLFWDKF